MNRDQENGKPIIEAIKAAGYKVYQRPGGDSYCYVEDVKGQLAYVQWPRYDGVSISSVHKANSQCGTGFRIADKFSLEGLKQALYCVAPPWHRSMSGFVKKYTSMDNYKQSSTFAGDYQEV